MQYGFSVFLFVIFTACEAVSQVGTEYYIDSQLIFCEDVVNANPVNASTYFFISRDGGYVTIFVDNKKPLKTDKLVIHVWKMSVNDEYEEFIETKKIDIPSNSYSAFFKYVFYKAGKYKIVVNNKYEEWINTGYVSINYSY